MTGRTPDRGDLERENAALRKQVDMLTRQLAPPPLQPTLQPDARETCYLIAIPATVERTQAIVNLARVALPIIRRQMPDYDWQAAHRLDDLPSDAVGVRLGDFLSAAFGGAREIRLYGRDGDTLRFMPTSDQFERFDHSARRILDRVDTFIDESEAAYADGYHSRAVGYILIAKVLLAEHGVMIARFTAGLDWKTADVVLAAADGTSVDLDAKTACEPRSSHSG